MDEELNKLRDDR